MTSDSYQTIKVEEQAPLVKFTLSRPEVKNAFDEKLIAELTEAVKSVEGRRDLRVAILTGAGEVFSAGADLNWMRRVAGYTYEENVSDAMGLADLVETLYMMPQATIARVNGPCIGGGLGLLAACDVAVASSDAFFAFREVRLGITPATISPYVIRKIGERNARDYFLTGRRIGAKSAEAIGLVNEVSDPDGLDDAVEKWAGRFLHSGPEAIKACKQLIARVSNSQIREVKAHTADLIAKLRGSEEGKEGFAAFFEKRKPDWDAED
ncbi:MAG: enoyl-CoA hydratase/isomerase family protein [Candidatus Latescibacterota bacterium]|jgi:methylglutaconyl-CoA hydratase